MAQMTQFHRRLHILMRPTAGSKAGTLAIWPHGKNNLLRSASGLISYEHHSIY